MKKCALCNDKEANQTGSHIVPHFLMKNIDNEENYKSRNKELGFSASSSGINGYFGRAVLPEKLEQVYGEVTEELIENNRVPLVIDNIFCKQCEGLFTVIETEYSNNLAIYKGNQSIINKVRPFISFLFWISIFWRLSICNNIEFKLKKKIENRFRRILQNYLRNNIKYIVPINNDKYLKRCSIKILQSMEDEEIKYKNLVVGTKSEYPYYLIVDNYIVALYLNKNKKHKSAIFCEINRLLNLSKTNTAFKGEFITFIKSAELEKINNQHQSHEANSFINSFLNIFDGLHRKLGGQGDMPAKFKKEIFDNIINDTSPIGKKYSIKNIAKITFNTLKKYMGTES